MFIIKTSCLCFLENYFLFMSTELTEMAISHRPIMNIDKMHSKEATSTWLDMLMISFTKLTLSKVTSTMVTDVGDQM